MENKKNTEQNQNKKQILLNNLYEFLNSTKDQTLQLNPQDGDILQRTDSFRDKFEQKDLEEYKRDYSSRIDKQLLIIAQNISNSLFNLPNQKFTAFMSRYEVWGLDLTLQQFIINFYLVVKTDNMLRQFVMLHMDKIIKTVKEYVEKYLITHMFDFNFKEPRTDYVKKQLVKQMKQNDLKLKEKLADQKFEEQPKTEEVQEAPIPEQHVEGQKEIKIEPFEAQVEKSNSIPYILSMDEMLKMSDDELKHLQKTIENKNIPQIQDNMKDVLNKEGQLKEKKEETSQPTSKEEPVENQTEDEKKMAQQILNNLKQQHQNLERGFTNNG